MEQRTSSNRTKLMAVVLSALVLLTSANLFAMNTEKNLQSKTAVSNNEFSENAIKNLITGIKSENTGLRKSSIYFAGKYEIEEAVEVLVEQLNEEKDANIKILIALALYKIGTEEGLTAVQELSINDDNKKVRRMGRAILEQAVFESGETISIK